MRLRLKVLIGILVVLSLVNGFLFAYNINTKMQINQTAVISLQNELQQTQTDLVVLYKVSNINFEAIAQNFKLIPNYIDAKIQRKELDKFILEQKLKQVNVMVKNQTLQGLGSGVTLKYKDKFYVLTAGHMAEANTDKLELWENEMKVCDLKILKHNYFFPTNDTRFSEGMDLLLLAPTDENIKPHFYVELADFEPVTGTEMYVVGNPMGIEDVISDGRIIIYKNNFFYYIDHSYYGNSGGGIYNKEGKLIGIMCHYVNLKPEKDLPDYIVYGAMRLSVIQQFLEDVK